MKIEANGTYLNPDVSVSAYWDDEALARYGITFEDLMSGRVSYWRLVALEERREEKLKSRMNWGI